MYYLDRFVQAISKFLLTFGAFALYLMMLHISADVCGKYFFNHPIVGTLETVSRFYMVICVFLPIAWVQIQRQHLTVEVFTMKIAGRRAAMVDGVAAILGATYSGILTWLVFGQAVEQTGLREFVSITYFDLPVWPSRWFLPLSFGLLTIVMVLQAIVDLRYGMTGRKPSASGEANA